MHNRQRTLFSGAIFGIAVFALAGIGSSPAMAKDTQSFVDSANTYAEKGELKAAEIELRNALRQAPQDAHIHAMLAQVYLKQGEFASAEREARSARDLKGDEADYLLTLAEAMRYQGKFADIPVEIKPGNRAPELESKVRIILAAAARDLGDRGKAETLLREAVAIDPNAPGAKLALASQLLGTKPEEAGKLADEVLAADPRSVNAIVIKGEILTAQRDTDGAIKRFDEALAIDPNNLNAHLNRANVYLSRRAYDSVDKDLDVVLKISPANFGANYLRAWEDFEKRDFAAADKILDRLAPGFDRVPEGFYVQAATKYGLGQYEQATDAINKFVARVPESPVGVRLAAALALRRGAPDIAVQYLTKYLAKATPDPATLTLLGNSYTALKEPDLALEQYQKAAALAPENPALKTLAAASQIDNGAGRKGLEELEQVFATDTGATVAGPTLVIVDLRAGRVDKAADTAEQLVKRDGNNLLYQTLLGAVRMAQRDYPTAETIFKALVDKTPDSAAARTNLAHAYLSDGKTDAAKKTYQDFLVRKPGNVSALLGLADIAWVEKNWDEAIGYANQARSASPADPAPGLKLMAIYAGQQNWERAKALASELTSQFPSNADVLDWQGRILLASGDRDGATEAYRRAYKIAPTSEAILSRYLSLLVAAKQFSEYRTVQEGRLNKDPGNRTIKAQLIRAEADAGGLEAGLDKARSFAKDDPDKAWYDIISASLYEQFDKRVDAIALLEKAANTWPANDDVAIALSGAYSRAGDQAKSEAVLTNRLKDRPDATSIRAALGRFYIKNKKLDSALDQETRLLTERPDDPIVLNNLAWLYQQKGNLTKARELAEKAAGIAPANGSIADTLGWILLAQGDTANALARLQAASAAMPGDPEIRYHVAAALDRAGRPADARALLEQLLGSGASFESKTEAEKLLEGLKRG
jgi:putative PEP-CTERM system TPR-repeat lipoprotein